MDKEIQTPSKSIITLPQQVEEAVQKKFPLEEFKAWFYMLSGKADSTIKFFHEPINVNRKDIIELHKTISDKLKTHQLEGVIATINITFANNTVKEFGDWNEFLNHSWTTPEITTSVLIKWDFLIKLQSSPVPQRHTVTIHISEEIEPEHFIQALFSSKINPYNLRKEVSPMYCRVEFINQSMSEELIAKVSDWHSSRKNSELQAPFLNFADKHSDWIHRIIRYSIPTFSFILLIGCFFSYSERFEPTSFLTTHVQRNMLAWQLCSILLIFMSLDFSRRISVSTMAYLSRSNKQKAICLTAGDDKHEDKLMEENKDNTTSFVIRFGGTILYDIVITIIAAKCLNLLYMFHL